MNTNIKKNTFNTIEPIVKKVGSSVLKGSNKLLKGCIKVLSDIACEMDFKAGYLDFVSRPDDIFVVTYPRSGTTWMQMILYQITTDGNMDFTHICEVSPWFERFLSFNVMEGKDFEKFSSPRVIKSHLPFQEIPKGPGKYIYVARSGKDVAVSYYHLYKSHLHFQGSFDDFYKLFIKGKVLFGSWFKHVADWKKHRDDQNVLFLEYEDLLKDFGTCLQKIIKFCGIELSQPSFQLWRLLLPVHNLFQLKQLQVKEKSYLPETNSKLSVLLSFFVPFFNF